MLIRNPWLMLFFYCCRCYHQSFLVGHYLFAFGALLHCMCITCDDTLNTKQNSINHFQLIRAYCENILNIFIVRLSVVQMNALHRTLIMQVLLVFCLGLGLYFVYEKFLLLLSSIVFLALHHLCRFRSIKHHQTKHHTWRITANSKLYKLYNLSLVNHSIYRRTQFILPIFGFYHSFAIAIFHIWTMGYAIFINMISTWDSIFIVTLT